MEQRIDLSCVHLLYITIIILANLIITLMDQYSTCLFLL